jgi:phenylacetate-CoA ligase
VLTLAVRYVPHYRASGITLAQCRNEDPFDLVRELPFLTKAQVMAEPEAFVSERVPRWRRYQKSSSGSSGQGILLWRTKRTADIEKAFLDQQWAPWGWSSESSRILRMGDDARRKLEEYPVRLERNRLLVSSLHLTDPWLPSIYDQAVAFKPQFIHAYSSCAISLARFIVETGRRPLRIGGLLLTSEPLPAAWVPTLQAAFAADISINYGLTERTNFAEAVVRRDGPARIEYRVNPVYGYQENFEHPDGRCEIVGTSYWNDVMPLIRYRTGDFGRIRDGRIEHMDGRELEYLVTKQGRQLPGLSVEPEAEVWDKVRQLQVYQPEPGRIEFRVVPKPGVSQGELDSVMATFDPLWADFFDLSVRVVDDIPRLPSGKTRLVVRERGVREAAS